MLLHCPVLMYATQNTHITEIMLQGMAAAAAEEVAARLEGQSSRIRAMRGVYACVCCYIAAGQAGHSIA